MAGRIEKSPNWKEQRGIFEAEAKNRPLPGSRELKGWRDPIKKRDGTDYKEGPTSRKGTHKPHKGD